MTAATRVGLACLGLVLLGATALSACGRSGPPPQPPVARLHGPHLWVSIAPDANQNSPVAVDLVFVSSSRLVKMLQQVPVANWFQQRAQWELDNPGLLTVLSWQWVPGQKIAPIPLHMQGGTKAVLVFAGYRIPGAKPLTLVLGGGGLALRLLTSGVAGYGVR